MDFKKLNCYQVSLFIVLLLVVSICPSHCLFREALLHHSHRLLARRGQTNFKTNLDNAIIFLFTDTVLVSTKNLVPSIQMQIDRMPVTTRGGKRPKKKRNLAICEKI